MCKTWMLLSQCDVQSSQGRKVGCYNALFPSKWLIICRFSYMDYVLNSALHYNMANIQRCVLFYDSACKYRVYLRRRFEESKGLDFPPFEEWMEGVGIWHIYSHISTCYPRFTPLYIPRIGMVDGEVIETLWARLNLISPSCRTMSLSNEPWWFIL